MSVKSAVRVVRIFELLSNHPDGLTVKEISKELSSPQSSTFNLAATLLDEGYLQQDAVKRYRLGAKLIQVGTGRHGVDRHFIAGRSFFKTADGRRSGNGVYGRSIR
nr:helix-turn-helix domain-containing protein [Bacillus licheniformis]